MKGSQFSNSTIQECISKSSQWLLKIQNKDDGGWGQYKGSNSNCLNTAEAMIALIETQSQQASANPIQKGKQYLINQQIKQHEDQKNYGAWSKIILVDHARNLHIPDTIRTSLAILALQYAGVSADDDSIRNAIQWLLRVKNDDGGWGYKPAQDSLLFPTCMILKALLNTCSDDNSNLCSNFNLQKIIVKGLRYIEDNYYHNQDGSFGVQDGLKLSHTLHVIDVLKIAENQNFRFRQTDLPGKSIQWVRENKNSILNWSSELIIIGEDAGSPYNYIFSHINPAMYLRIIFKDLQKTKGFNTEVDVAYDALGVISNDLDPTDLAYGFCGKRAVSWATSHTILGLQEALCYRVLNAPRILVLDHKVKKRQFFLFFLIIMATLNTITILSILDKTPPNLNQGLLIYYLMFSFSLIILVALLVYGYLSEESFIKLAGNQFLLSISSWLPNSNKK